MNFVLQLCRPGCRWRWSPRDFVVKSQREPCILWLSWRIWRIDSGIFAYLCQVCEWEAKWIHSANRWRKGCSTLSLASQVCLRNSNSKNVWRKRTWLNARASWASSSISISMCFPIQHTHIYIIYNYRYIYKYHISMNHLWICLSSLSINQSIYLASIHSCSTMFGMTNNRICTKVSDTFNLYQANSDRRMQPGRLKCAVGMLWKHTMVDSCINGTITDDHPCGDSIHDPS